MENVLCRSFYLVLFEFLIKLSLSLLKKIDVFSTEKSGDKWRKMALFRALTLALNVGSWAEQG